MADKDLALRGAAELTRKLAELGALDKKAIRSVVRAGITPALVKARATAPVGTRFHKSYKGNVLYPGYLHKHLRVATTVQKGIATALLGPTKEAFYGTAFVEIGTSKMAAQPWLRPAFRSTLDAQKSAMVDKLNSLFAKVAAGGVME